MWLPFALVQLWLFSLSSVISLLLYLSLGRNIQVAQRLLSADLHGSIILSKNAHIFRTCKLQLQQSAIAYPTLLVILRHMIRVPFVLDIKKSLSFAHKQTHTGTSIYTS